MKDVVCSNSVGMMKLTFLHRALPSPYGSCHEMGDRERELFKRKLRLFCLSLDIWVSQPVIQNCSIVMW